LTDFPNPDASGSGLSLNISENDNSLDLDLAREVAAYFRVDAKESDELITAITSVVKKYQLGDTIYKNQCILSTQEKLLYYSLGNDPVCVFNNIDLFLEDTSYIVFEKSNGDLYYLKIFIPYKSTLELIYAKTSDQTFGIDENDLLQNSIYPNPATELINFKKDFDLIEIYNIQGTLLIEKNESYTQNTIDISSLKSGFYIVILKKDSAKYLTKLIKR
jgi:hypothetical protein